jgi:hypothetical protein
MKPIEAEIVKISLNPIWWFKLLFCFRLQIDFYFQNLPNVLSSDYQR